MTLCDYWEIRGDATVKSNRDRGISRVLIHSEKGQRLLNHIEPDLISIKRVVDELNETNPRFLRNPPPLSDQDDFFAELDTLSFDRLVRKYCPVDPAIVSFVLEVAYQCFGAATMLRLDTLLRSIKGKFAQKNSV